jgi:hypothetical protein
MYTLSYKHLLKIELIYLEIDKVTMGVLLTMSTSLTTERIILNASIRVKLGI